MFLIVVNHFLQLRNYMYWLNLRKKFVWVYKIQTCLKWST